MIYSNDASPAYRGYRLQVLYTLWRILGIQNSQSNFQPEGLEDLTIYSDSLDKPTEIVQIKAYSDDLALSDLQPNSPHSFLHRVTAYLEIEPRPSIKLVCFGSVGPELEQALSGIADAQEQVIKKLVGYGFSHERASDVVETLELVRVDENQLTENVENQLQQLLTGVAPKETFDLLNLWLYRCAEEKTYVSQQEIIQKITQVGSFLSERYAFHQEWFTTIKPIELDKGVELDHLADEFYEGISARYEHIFAGVDVKRPEKLASIEAAYQKHNVVIIHGASGQGKSTLAYRYIHDFYPNNWRFQVRGIQSRKHAFSITTALLGHINAIGLPTIVYLDVTPSETDWTDLVRELASHRLIRVLVTIREEDFRRASISHDEFQYSTLELMFDEQEANAIYVSLQAVKQSENFISFVDAWSRFGEQGPLLEFVYLVTQGESLRSKLERQISRLRDEVRTQKLMPNELELLTLVAVASSYSGRLRISSVVNDLNLSEPARTFELLEKEYLLKVDANENLVFGIHPIRSAILSDLLVSDNFYPWHKAAEKCLAHLYEKDVEIFLLHTFLWRDADTEAILKTLTLLSFNNWISVCGVMNALIWLGLKYYADENSDLLYESFKRFGSWMLTTDIDISDAAPGVANSAGLGKLLKPEARDEISQFRSRQTDKSRAFQFLRDWVSSASFDLKTPKQLDEWSAAAECCVKVGHFNLNAHFTDIISEAVLKEPVYELPIEVLADLIFGIYSIENTTALEEISVNYERLVNKYLAETQALKVEDDGNTVMLHFWIEVFPNKENNTDSKENETQRQNNETVRLLRTLHKLLPDREVYASQGYGHDVFPWELPFDDTHKKIAQQNLADDRLTDINSTFRGIAEYRLRKASWYNYALDVIDLRRKIVDLLKELIPVLESHFRQTKLSQPTKAINAGKWESLKEELRRPILLPKCAVDAWGRSDELLPEQSGGMGHASIAKLPLSLRLIRPFQKDFERYRRDIGNFFNQAIEVMIVSPVFGRTTAAHEVLLAEATKLGINLKSCRLSVINLHSSIKIISTVQLEFASFFGPFLDDKGAKNLYRLEHEENEVLNVIADMWLFFAMRPRLVLQNPKEDCSDKALTRLKEIKKHLRRNWKHLEAKGINVEVLSDSVRWERDPALWITVDSEDAFESFNAIEAVLRSTQEAVQKVGDRETTELILDRHWNYFLVIPTVHKKAVFNLAWNIHWVDAYRDLTDLDVVSRMPREIPSGSLQELPLDEWEGDRIDLGKSLVANVVGLSILAAQFKEFEKLPDLDQIGLEKIKSYFHGLNQSISDYLQAASHSINAIAELLDELNQNSDEEIEKRPHLTQVALGIRELISQVVPEGMNNGQFLLSLEEGIAWAKQLEVAQDTAFNIALHWLSDYLMLSEIGN